ncbi:MAG: exosortase family protein XrtM [Gammaproteobacteria bacterium]|nr:exosortase family protein XrtM [Gammaproteobacteria bacterium]
MLQIGPELRFTLKFVALFGLFYAGYMSIPDDFLRDRVFYHGITQVSASIIDLVAPQEAVQAESNRLYSSKAALRIIRGCDGSGALFLLVAAVLVFPVSAARKLAGVLGAVLLVYVLNQLRVVGLYFVVAYERDLFLPIHTYFAPTLIVVLCSAFFAGWAIWSGRRHHDSAAAS